MTIKDDAWKDEAGSWKVRGTPTLEVGQWVNIRLNSECETRCDNTDCEINYHAIVQIGDTGVIDDICKGPMDCPKCGENGTTDFNHDYFVSIRRIGEQDNDREGNWFCAQELEIIKDDAWKDETLLL